MKVGYRKTRTQLVRSGWDFEEEVQPDRKEDQVWRPPGQDRRKLPNAAHGFHEAGDAPVTYSDGDADGHTANRAAGAHQKSEWDCEQHTYRCYEGVGNFDVPLYRQTGNIETGAAQLFNIAIEFGPIHLKCLANFAIEIIRGLGQLGEGLHVKLIEAGDGTAR